MAAHSFKHVERAHGVGVEVFKRHTRRQVVRGLGRAVNHGLRADLLDHRQHRLAIADVDVAVDVPWHVLYQPCADPGRVAILTEEMATQVVVQADHLVALAGEMHHGFAADEAAAACHKNSHAVRFSRPS
jgi:hypothetical protein